jgi:hypothetical protein
VKIRGRFIPAKNRFITIKYLGPTTSFRKLYFAGAGSDHTATLPKNGPAFIAGGRRADDPSKNRPRATGYTDDKRRLNPRERPEVCG